MRDLHHHNHNVGLAVAQNWQSRYVRLLRRPVLNDYCRKRARSLILTSRLDHKVGGGVGSREQLFVLLVAFFFLPRRCCLAR
jgi:hypothetical protein